MASLLPESGTAGCSRIVMACGRRSRSPGVRCPAITPRSLARSSAASSAVTKASLSSTCGTAAWRSCTLTPSSIRPRATACCTSARMRVSRSASDCGSRSWTSRNRWLTARTVTLTVARSSSRVSAANPVMLVIIRTRSSLCGPLARRPAATRACRPACAPPATAARTACAYKLPLRASRSSCRPTSTIRPRSMTRIASARRMVDSRCAMTNEVRFFIRLTSASCTSCSDSVSSDEVASSRISSGESFSKRARDGQTLPLPARQPLPPLADGGLVALGQRLDEVVRVGSPGRGLDRLARRIGTSVCDVVRDGVVKQHRLLSDDADLRAHRRQRDVADVHAVDADGAARDVVEARDQVDQRRLARAAAAHNRDHLAGMRGEAHPAQDGSARGRRRRRRRRPRTPACAEMAPAPAAPGFSTTSVWRSSTSKTRSAAAIAC